MRRSARLERVYFEYICGVYGNVRAMRNRERERERKAYNLYLCDCFLVLMGIHLFNKLCVCVVRDSPQQDLMLHAG